MRKPVVYVLIGVPGSGKSTWAKNQPWASDCAYVSTDMLVDMEAERQGKTYNDVFKDYMPTAVDLMVDQVVAAREKGQDIIWDQTSVNVKSRKKKFSMLPNYDHIAVVFKTPDEAELTRRLASRPGKNIPDIVMRSMIDGFEMPDEEEGYKEIWHV